MRFKAFALRMKLKLENDFLTYPLHDFNKTQRLFNRGQI